ncbi:MAG TPA: transglutaminaseTgpA domain-containing protein [Polyangiaceae bacterium]|nr:transglutaminaseTgpA domain-containing protein [Polyangiaceae bacterium]
MRFGVVHRVMTDTLAVLGLLALLTSGELDRTVAYVVLGAMAVALALPERLQDRPAWRKAAVAAPLVLLGVQVLRLAGGESLLAASIEFAAGLQVLRLATRRGAAHDQQVIVLALLHLIAGTVLGSGLTYGLCFLGFLIVTPGALVLSHLRREVEGNYRQGARDRTGLPVDVPRILRSRRVIGRQFLLLTCLLSVPIFVFTAVIFVLFPRVGLSLLLLNRNHPDRMVGFSEHVDLGGVGRLRSDPTIVMRVDPPGLPATAPPRLALYLRGAAFDRYDGRAWSRTHREELPADQIGADVKIRRFPDPVRDRVMHIDLESIDPPVVFLPLDAVALHVVSPAPGLDQARPELFLGGEGVLRYSSSAQRGLRYDVSLANALESPLPALTASERTRYLSLPPLPARIAELAEAWTAGATTPRERAHLIEANLRSGYRYDLDSPSGAAKNPLEDFLFKSKRGHCEFYSTAMTVMLRDLGVPARNVTGFVGGTYNRFSHSYVVRQGDAHSWVEVWLDGAGWTRFDPTPPSDAAPRSELTGVLAVMRDFVEALGQRWSHHVIGYDLRQQLGLYDEVHDAYLRMIPRRGVAGRVFASPRKTVLGALALAGVGFGAYQLLRRRQQPKKGRERTDDERGAHEAAALYRALERLLAARGVPRPSSTPPLTHARSLEALGHPLGAETVELTERYLRVRFGGELLDHAGRRAYLDRLQAMRAMPVEARGRSASA